jgi:serine/threonine-protein kinase
MPLAVALQVIEQAARALAVAEVCGVVHRDIKPSNIMLESDPSETLIVKVIDYGVAKVMGPQAEAGAEETRVGFIGTPAFASPEQFIGAGQTPIDTRSDIYSLGVTLWYLLTGKTPFVGRTMEEIRARQTDELPLEQLKGLHLPGQVVTLLKSMLAPDPKDRPPGSYFLLSIAATYDLTLKRAHNEGGSHWRELRPCWQLLELGLASGCTSASGLSLRWNGPSRCCLSRT